MGSTSIPKGYYEEPEGPKGVKKGILKFYPLMSKGPKTGTDIIQPVQPTIDLLPAWTGQYEFQGHEEWGWSNHQINRRKKTEPTSFSECGNLDPI